MRALRGVLFIGVVLLLAVGVVAPSAWFYALATLTNPVESDGDVETYFRQSIESERHAIHAPLHKSARLGIKFERPQLTQFPEKLVNSFVGATGCPSFFKTPKETGWPYFRRELDQLLRGRDQMGNGACELIFCRNLAIKMGASSALQVAAAADRIHAVLTKEDMVAFELASVRFTDGVIGVADGARVLLQRELKDLSDAEVAEFQLGLPPLDYLDELWTCKNSSLVRGARDSLLQRMVRQGQISEDAGRAGTQAEVRCLAVKR